MEWFVDSFCGCVHKSFVTMSSKFGKIWTWFDPPNIEFLTRRGLKNRVFASGWDFTYHRLNRLFEHGASIQPVSSLFCVRVFDLVFWLHRCISNYMHRINRRYWGAWCFARSTDVKIFLNVGLTDSQPFSFWHSSGQLHWRWIWILSDHPVRISGWTDGVQTWTSDQPVIVFHCCWLWLIGSTDILRLIYVGSTGELYCAVSCTVFRSCFRDCSRLFLGLFCVGVAHP